MAVKAVVIHARGPERRGIFLGASTPIEHCVSCRGSGSLVRGCAESAFELFKISGTYQERCASNLTLCGLRSGLRSVGLAPSGAGLAQGDPDPDQDGDCYPANPDPFARLQDRQHTADSGMGSSQAGFGQECVMWEA